MPDGNFPTCPYTSPEIKEAMALGMEYAKKENADLLLATDFSFVVQCLTRFFSGIGVQNQTVCIFKAIRKNASLF